MDTINKSDRQDKLPSCTHLQSIISYSINSWYPNSEYFPIREYSDIHAIMSQISLHLYKYVTNVFNIRTSVSIDIKLYVCKICAYNIEYFPARAFLRVSAVHWYFVNWLYPTKISKIRTEIWS